MKTTALAVENVIAGLQVLIWISVYALILACENTDQLNQVFEVMSDEKYKPFFVPFTILTMGLSYTLGVVVNSTGVFVQHHDILGRFFDKFLFTADEIIPEKVNEEHLLYIRMVQNELAEDLDAQKRTATLIGTTSFNLCILDIVAFYFMTHFYVPQGFNLLHSKSDRILASNIAVVVLVIGVASIMALGTWIILKRKYLTNVETAHKLSTQKSGGDGQRGLELPKVPCS